MTTVLYKGVFLWFSPIIPSGLCSAILNTDTITKNDALHKGLVLDYSTKLEMIDASISKSKDKNSILKRHTWVE